MPIKMTKELPNEAGEYYFASDVGGTPIIGEVYNGTFFYSDQQMAVNGMRGYWAKVDKDQFEFEG